MAYLLILFPLADGGGGVRVAFEPLAAVAFAGGGARATPAGRCALCSRRAIEGLSRARTTG